MTDLAYVQVRVMIPIAIMLSHQRQLNELILSFNCLHLFISCAMHAPKAFDHLSSYGELCRPSVPKRLQLPWHYCNSYLHI